MTWHTSTSPEQWLAEVMSRGPRPRYPVIRAGWVRGWPVGRIERAAEHIGVIALNGKNGIHWYRPPRGKLDALRLLDAHQAGRLSSLRPWSRQRILTEALAIAGMGECYSCHQFLPLEQLFEDGVGLGCDPCSML